MVRERPGDASDEALVGRARHGDASALDMLVARHLDAVYQVALRVLADRDAAQDAAQETWIRVLRSLDTFRGEASFRTWLLRVAANAARSAGRRSTRRRESPLPEEPAVDESAADPAAAAVLRGEAARIELALAELPEKQRMAVSLRIYQGLSHREIGEVIDSTEASARVNYHHGIKRLRELLG